MSEWPQLPLDALGTVERGRSRHRPRNDPALYGGPYPFVQTGDIKAAGLRLYEYTQTYSEAGLAQSRLWPAGTLCFTIAANIGDTAILGIPACFPDSIVGFTADPDLADPVFVKYALDYAKLRFTSISRGAAQDNLSLEKLLTQQLPVPPLETQRRIASILGGYDDLIEVNRRRVAVLEEMARGLFEEWFVRFRFPGHESVPLVGTPDGPLPEGWSWGQAKEVIAFDPKTKVPKDGDKPFIPMGHLDTATSLIASPESRTGNSGAKFRNGDTLFARITPCLENGKTGLVRSLPSANGVGFGSTEFIVMRGERSGPAFTYCLSRLPGFREHARSSMSGASGRQRARTESVETYAMAIPASDDLFDRFESAVWPMLELVGKLGNMSERLAASRDLLLPRLISGQLSVEAAERDLELAA
jgi:type I restriction enzyme S subunit